MELSQRLRTFFFERHAPCVWCHVRVEFTGEPARTPAEALIADIAKGRKEALFHWLEDRLAETLYAEELRRGAWVTDLGISGPASFRREACGMLQQLRPEFGSLKKAA